MEKNLEVKNIGEAEDAGYHRGQEDVSQNRSQIVFAFVGMEQSSMSRGGSYETLVKQTDRSEWVRFLV